MKPYGALGQVRHPRALDSAAFTDRFLSLGGVLMMIDGNLEIKDENLNMHPRAYGEDGEEGTSWFARTCFG